MHSGPMFPPQILTIKTTLTAPLHKTIENCIYVLLSVGTDPETEM